MSWFLATLLGTLLYAMVNLLDDNLLSFVYKSPYLSTVSAGFYGSLPLLTRIFIHTANIPFPFALLSATAGFLTLAYYLFYFKGLQSDTPAVVVALLGLAPATLPFLAHFLVHERLFGMEFVGFVVVLLASLGLAVSDVKRFKFSGALIPLLVAVVLLDAVSIMSKYVYERADFYPAYLYFSAGMGIGGIFFLLLKFSENKKNTAKISKDIKKLWPLFVVTELLALASDFVLNFAISRGPVSLVRVVEGVQPMFVLLIALALYPLAPKYFREAKVGGSLRKLTFMGLVIIGLAVIGVAAKV